MRVAGAAWRGPVPGMGPGQFRHPAFGVVMHIMGGSMQAADGWFHNPSSQVSAHFGIGLGGELVQWVDTDDRAWHAGAANPNYYGVETEGSSGPLTPAQVRTFATLYMILARLDGFPFQLANTPGEHGLIYHGAGGAAWGGHPYCPGAPRIAQRAEILNLAAQPADDHNEECDMLLILGADGVPALYSAKDYKAKAGIPNLDELTKLTKGVEGRDYVFVKMSHDELAAVPNTNGQPGL